MAKHFGTSLADKLMMNFNDLLIIYLACGAPLGVYYFLQHRRIAKLKYLWFKTFLNFIFWIPFAFRLLLKNNFLDKFFKNIFDGDAASDSNIEKLILPLRKNLETSISKISQTSESIPKVSIFEVREIFDRYIGLTIAGQIERKNSQAARTESDFYKVSGHKNACLATICAIRRNRQRLFFHQTEARQDFLNLINTTADQNFRRQIIEFVGLLKDSEAQFALEKIFARKAQTEKLSSVKDTEKDLWKSEIRKPLPINQLTSTRLKLSRITMNLRAKD